MVASIEEYSYHRQRRKDQIYSWMTKNIATAVTFELHNVDEYGNDPLSDWLDTLSLDPRDLEKVKDKSQKKAEPVKPPTDNGVGSFERLIAAFRGGGPG